MKTKTSSMLKHLSLVMLLTLPIALPGVSMAEGDIANAEATSIGVGTGLNTGNVSPTATIQTGDTRANASIGDINVDPRLTSTTTIDGVSGGSASVSGVNPVSQSQGGKSASAIDFKYAPTSVSITKIPKPQAATNASAFVPTPGVMQEFSINSDAAKAANLLDVYAGFACGPKAYTSGKFEATKIELSNTDGDEDIDVSVVFSPRPGFVKNDTDTQPAAAFSVYHKNMLWGQKFTCLGIVDVNPDDVQQRLGPSVLENAAGAVGSSSMFGHYKNIVLMYTKDSVQLRSGSASSVETKGFTISGSGTPGVSGFAQGAIGWGKTDGVLVHTDVSALKMLVLAIDPNGRSLPSYDQFELGILSNMSDQRRVLNGSASVPAVSAGAQSVGAAGR